MLPELYPKHQIKSLLKDCFNPKQDNYTKIFKKYKAALLGMENLKNCPVLLWSTNYMNCGNHRQVLQVVFQVDRGWIDEGKIKLKLQLRELSLIFGFGALSTRTRTFWKPYMFYPDWCERDLKPLWRRCRFTGFVWTEGRFV